MIKPVRFLIAFIVMAIVVAGVDSQAYADTTETSTYGSGNYGSCDYGTCGITLLSGGSTNIDITPTAAGKCTVQSDTVSVQTGNTNGYTLTLTASTTNNALVATSGSIAAVSGSPASPATLSMNTWGYRVDGQAGFGGGPTSAQTNGSVPSAAFAAVPPSDQAGSAVKSSTSAADTPDDTTVWYGACADTTIPAGSYTSTVLYTAVANE